MVIACALCHMVGVEGEPCASIVEGVALMNEGG
jgi:hypothetical protein